jgi:hypothetical protein
LGKTDSVTISIPTGQGESIVRLPARITCHEDFVRSILKIRAHSGKKGGEAASRTDYIEAVYYLLAWLVGDAGKGFGSERLHTARIEVNLCRRHSENLGLGEYVTGCIRMVGVPCKRLPDKVSDPSEPHGSFRWLSGFSQVIGWMHATCLGLDWNQRTSYNPVKMDWLLSAPPECRMWFIRGLADSDGSVHFRHKSAEIVTSPNTTLIRDILASLHVHNVLDFSKGCGRISISGQTAAEIQIFNPRILTHRRKLLEKLVRAETFQRRWPAWLESRVQRMLCEGLSPPAVARRIFNEDEVYIKMATVIRKRRLMLEKSHGRDTHPQGGI